MLLMAADCVRSMAASRSRAVGWRKAYSQNSMYSAAEAFFGSKFSAARRANSSSRSPAGSSDPSSMARTPASISATWSSVRARKRSSLEAKFEYTAPLVNPAAGRHLLEGRAVVAVSGEHLGGRVEQVPAGLASDAVPG